MSKDVLNIFNYQIINETEEFEDILGRHWHEHHVFLFLNGYGASIARGSCNHPDTYELMLIKGTSDNHYELEGEDPIFNLDFEDVYNILVDIAEGNIEEYYW